MLRCGALFVLLGLVVTSGGARVWTDVQGRSLEAELLRVNATGITVRRTADGRVFDIPWEQLSAEDRASFAAPAPPASSSPSTPIVAPAAVPAMAAVDAPLNATLGLALLADESLWDDRPADVAARLGLREEGRNALFESYRAYPQPARPVAGAPAYTLALQATEGRPTLVTLLFTNRGDHAPFRALPTGAQPLRTQRREFDAALERDVATLAAALTRAFGAPTRESAAGSVDPDRRLLRWVAPAAVVTLVHTPGHSVALRLTPPENNPAEVGRLSDARLRRLWLDRLARRPQGDVIIDQLPMVSQGPKGYCMPATFERVLRYAGIPADMYELAAAGETGFAGGTRFTDMTAGLERTMRRHGRKLERLDGDLSLALVARQIDAGRPIIWGLSSTDRFNGFAGAYTARRAGVTDWAAWKRLTADLELAALGADPRAAHAALIIGYNRDTREVALSDSWGPEFAERWVPLAAASAVSLGELWVLGW